MRIQATFPTRLPDGTRATAGAYYEVTDTEAKGLIYAGYAIEAEALTPPSLEVSEEELDAPEPTRKKAKNG